MEGCEDDGVINYIPITDWYLESYNKYIFVALFFIFFEIFVSGDILYDKIHSIYVQAFFPKKQP